MVSPGEPCAAQAARQAMRNGAVFMPEAYRTKRASAKGGGGFPQCGNIFSIVWKNREKVFHCVENPDYHN